MRICRISANLSNVKLQEVTVRIGQVLVKYNLKTIAIFFSIFFVFNSCHSPKTNEHYQEQLVVFSVLSPNLNPQTVIVDRTYGIGDTVTDTTGISGASVLVWDNELFDTIYFTESDTPGFYHDNIDHWVKPLHTYNLQVSFDSDTVRAMTSVPDTFRFISPVNGETLHTSYLPIFYWTSAKETKSFFLCPFKADTTDTTGFIFPLIVTDTFQDMNLYKDAFFDTTGFYRIKNFALDENRYRYEVEAPRLDTLGDGIGMFGSETFDTVRVFIIKDSK